MWWTGFGTHVPLVLSDNPSEFEIPNQSFMRHQSDFTNKELTRLLLLDAIEPCNTKPKCPNSVLPKKNNKNRLIIDLRVLNGYCNPPKFVNKDIHPVKSVIQTNNDLATVDLKDGFLSVKVHPDYRDLLGFKWAGVYYRFVKLPFGLSLSPYYFTKVLRPVVKYLRSQGIRVVLYVDDFILLALPSRFTDHLDQLLNTLSELGWNINLEKSSLTPSKCVVYLGHRDYWK